MQTIGIVGLGLIGGSMAKTIKARTKCAVYGFDGNPEIIEKACQDGTLTGALTTQTLPLCDAVILCLYPLDVIAYVQDNLSYFAKNTLITDCAGVKTNVCTVLSPLCKANGLRFVGAHPMAGIEKSGYDASFGHLFDGASMVICEDADTQGADVRELEDFYFKLGFGKVTLTTPEEHDRIIAFTSQLAHVVSSTYVQSEQANQQMGFSAGSYQDLTRVAYLNEHMWSELFIENAAPLVKEVRGIVARMTAYADLIEAGDREQLTQLLRRGKEMKQRIG